MPEGAGEWLLLLLLWGYRPLVFADGWKWFAQPLGFGAITYWQAFGLLGLVSLPTFACRKGEAALDLSSTLSAVVAGHGFLYLASLGMR